MNDTFWRDDAACRLADARLFDAVDGERRGARDRVLAAQRICAACPVAARCLELALANHDSGVRAGQLLDCGRPRRLPAADPFVAVRHDGPIPCGTETAARRHYRRKEPLCGPCREAWRAKDRKRAA